MAKTVIMVRLDEEDKVLIREAAWHTRMPMAAWIRNIIVLEAQDQLKAIKGATK